MKVTWQVEDGYAGGSRRPHTTEIPDEEIRECETFEDAMQLIEDYVTEDYQQRISWAHKRYNQLEARVREILGEGA